MVQIRRTKELPDILEEMASYLRDSCLEQDYPSYWKEIVSTGLFHDAEGKVAELTDRYVKVKIEY